MNHHKQFALLLGVLFLALQASAQDIITKTNGDDISCHIVKITAKNIKYRPSGGADTAVASIPKKTVFSVKYETGLKEVFNESHVDDKDPDGHWDKRSMKDMGREDAEQYYHRAGGARAGTMITTMLTGAIIGLIPAIACSSTPPNDKHLDYPDAKLMQNEEYNNAYRKQAHKMKKGKVWGAYVTGIVIDLVCGVVYVAL